MKKSAYILKSFINSAGVFIYISAIVLLMSNGEAIFGEAGTMLIPIFMLLLFVISAVVTGYLVLGQPIFLYMDKKKKEAFIMLMSTIAWLALYLLIVGMFLIKY